MTALQKFVSILSITIILASFWAYTSGKNELSKQRAVTIGNVRPDGFVEFSNKTAVCFTGSACETMNLGQ